MMGRQLMYDEQLPFYLFRLWIIATLIQGGN